jgi:pimeloyl-ACP methyl ester carboxylesterase
LYRLMMTMPLDPMAALARFRETRRSLTHKGRAIAYWTEGAGPALLLVHGFPTSSLDWWKVWDALAARFTLVAADMLGFGFSDKPADDPYLLTDQATLHEALAAELGIAETHVLAHDYGVSVTQELLARQREAAPRLALRSVVFLNGGLFPEMHRATPGQLALVSEHGPALAAQGNRATFGEGVSAVFGPSTKPTAAELDAFWALAELQNGYALFPQLLDYMRQRRENRARWVGALEAAIVPQVLINGPEDPVSGRHAAEHYRAQVRNAEVVLLEGIGHWPQVEAPDAVVSALLAFHDKL